MKAYVVGSGPNGLAGAIELARNGFDVTVLEATAHIGGGLGSAELTEPGLVHDLGAAFLPMAVASPFFRSLDLEALGVRFRHAPIALAHPLDDGSAGLLHHDLGTTARGLGADGGPWRALFERFAESFPELLDDAMQPMVHLPRHPLLMARFGSVAAQSAARVAGTFRTEQGRALFTGVAAHAFGPLDKPFSSAVGVMLTAAAHAVGWPVVEGGAQVLADALVRHLVDLGGTVETRREVRTITELGDADVVLLDTTPAAAVAILGDAMPRRFRRAYGAYVHGPAAFKVDFAVEGDIPWTADGVRDAGVVHVGGSAAEVSAAEARIASGVSARQPFALVGQQYVADPGRSRNGVNPVWAYAHVPYGSTVDATERIVRQIERFAPGFRERIVSTHTTGAIGLAAANANYVGGDINTGATGFRQLVARPIAGRRPYRTGVPNAYLCSAATPPGPGVHGMAGANAANAAKAAKAAMTGPDITWDALPSS